MFIQEALRAAADYTAAYAAQYAVTDQETIDAIYYSHLAFLVNRGDVK